ncbi:hypothetical protein QA23_5255, partial [Saccharomyces cerevisiae Lalvin QA23]
MLNKKVPLLPIPFQLRYLFRLILLLLQFSWSVIFSNLYLMARSFSEVITLLVDESEPMISTYENHLVIKNRSLDSPSSDIVSMLEPESQRRSMISRPAPYTCALHFRLLSLKKYRRQL